MVFIVNVGNATVINLVRFFYDETLNGVRRYEIATDGADSTMRSELDTSGVVKIYRDNTLEFEGKVDERDGYQGGGIILRGIGQEKDLVDTKCPVTESTHKKVYTSTDANTIFADLVGNVSGWSSDVANSSATGISSFRTTDSQSVWIGVQKLIRLTGKDIRVDDSSKTLYLYDELTNSNVNIFNEGQNAGSFVHKKMVPKATKVIVYGKADGDNQIIGTAGSGTPVHDIIDRNIIDTTEADNRATIELAKIVSSINHYSFNVFNSSLTFRIGDEVTLNAHSVGLNGVTVDIVRIKRGLGSDGNEFLNLEVTNPEYREANRNNAELMATQQKDSTTAESSMQGSGNLSQWGNIGNANNSVPLKINFNVGDKFTDEVGNLQIRSMTLDYDVDKYIEQTGGASFDGSDPQVQNESENNDDLTIVAENDYFEANDIIEGTWTTIVTFANIGSHGDAITFIGNIAITGGDDDPTQYREHFVRIYNSDTAIYYPNSDGVRFMQAPRTTSVSTTTGGGSSHDHTTGNGTYDYFRLSDGGGNYAIKDETGSESSHRHSVSTMVSIAPNGNFTVTCPVDPFGDDFVIQMEHDGGASDEHDANIYVTMQVESRHKHNNGDYDINAADIDDISIGDNVGEAAATNATEVDVYLDYYNGSSWIEKHSIIGTGKTLDTGLDITNSGTYPDTTGLWRVRIYTDNGTADFLQGIVDIKHLVDN